MYTRLIDNELEQSQQFIFSALTTMSDVLVVCDERGLIEQANACRAVEAPPN